MEVSTRCMPQDNRIHQVDFCQDLITSNSTREKNIPTFIQNQLGILKMGQEETPMSKLPMVDLLILISSIESIDRHSKHL